MTEMVPELRLLVALAAGLLIGAEREQQRASEPSGGVAGLRTFGLIGLVGGLLGYLQAPIVVGAGAIAVGAVALAVHARAETKTGVATEIAMIATYGIGAVAISAPVLAASVSVMVASLMASGEQLHKAIRVTLTRQELRDALLLLLFALVILPIAPDRYMGPYNAIHPQSLVRLTVVLMAMSGAGYVAQRLLGVRLGLSALGFAGGFVSSVATIAAMGVRARTSTAWRSAAAGALASNVATIVLYTSIVALVDPSLVRIMTLPFALSGGAALLTTLALAWPQKNGHVDTVHEERAFRLRSALGFAAIVSLVGVGSAALKEKLGAASIVLISGAAALVDTHSTAGSIATQFRSGTVSVELARLAILVSLTTNSLTKLVMAASSRHWRYAITVSIGVVLVAAGAWLGAWLS